MNRCECLFDKNCTLIIKACAIIFLIMHHLFWNQPGYGMDFFGVTISQRIGLFSKVCVSIFVFLSGAGLQLSSFGKNKPNIHDSVGRVARIWLQYFVVVILSSLVGLAFFFSKFCINIPLTIEGFLKFLLTCTGVQYFIGYPGFNASWWYVTLTVVLYMAYPLIYKLLDRYEFKFVVVVVAFSFADIFSSKHFTLPILLGYLSPFVLGMFFVRNDNYLKIRKFFIEHPVVYFLLFSFMVFIAAYRTTFLEQSFITARIDTLFACLFVYFVYDIYSKAKRENLLTRVLCWLGSYSGTMYFLHMFVTTYYLGDEIMSLKYPFLIFLTAYVVSLVVSMIVDVFFSSVIYQKANSKFVSCVIKKYDMINYCTRNKLIGKREGV